MKQMRRVVITGLGIVSPLGNNLQTFWHLLSTGQSGIAPLSSFDTAPFSSSLAGEITDFDAEDFIPRKQARRMGRVSHFAVAAALMAVRDARLDIERENRSEMAICLGTSIAGLREAFAAHDSMLKHQHLSPFTMASTFPNAVSGEIAIALGINGECETYSIGCSSTANAIGRAFEMIRSGNADIILAGGTEAPLHPTIFSAMEAGRVLAPDHGGTVRNLPRPFDRTRCGMVLGEGAGCLILEDYDHARLRGAHMYAELEGWGFTCDAYSMARPLASGKEQKRAIDRALVTASWFPEEVDMSTPAAWGPWSSTASKQPPSKNHWDLMPIGCPSAPLNRPWAMPFAASGAFQVIGTALAMEHQYHSPTLHLTNPDPTC